MKSWGDSHLECSFTRRGHLYMNRSPCVSKPPRKRVYSGRCDSKHTKRPLCLRPRVRTAARLATGFSQSSRRPVDLARTDEVVGWGGSVSTAWRGTRVATRICGPIPEDIVPCLLNRRSRPSASGLDPEAIHRSAFAIVVTQFSDVVGASTRNSGLSCANCSHSLSAQRRSPPQHVRQ